MAGLVRFTEITEINEINAAGHEIESTGFLEPLGSL